MADFWSGQVGNNYCPQIRLSASVTSYNDTSDTISWTLDYVAHGYGFYTSGNRQWYANIGGQQWSGTANVYGATGTVRLGSGTKVVAKTHNDKNVSCSASMSLNGYWNGAYINWAECSGSVFTGKKTTYTVSYNANGGSGAPGSQTKWHGETLTLSRTRPSRTGYNFSRWNTNTSNTGTAYNPGGSYTANSGATLYAIWSPYTYTVSYNANGGTGAPSAQTKTYGKTLTLSSTRPTRTNYNFLGWGTSTGSTSVAYSPGSAYTANAGITLYAIWQLAYVAPRISNLTADRCLANGTIDDTGDKVKVRFSWSTDRTVTTIVIRWRLQSNAIWLNSKTISASGTSGTVSTIINAVFNTEQSYVIEVGVRDSGGVRNAQTTVGSTEYIIDLRKGGKGVAIGAAANKDGFTVGWPATFNEGVDINDHCTVNSILKVNKRIDAVAGMNSGTNITMLADTAQLRSDQYGGSWITSRRTALASKAACSKTNSFYNPVVSVKTKDGEWSMGALNSSNNLYLSYTKDSDFNANNNTCRTIAFSQYGGFQVTSLHRTQSYSDTTVKLSMYKTGRVVSALVSWVGTAGVTNKSVALTGLDVPAGWRPIHDVYFNPVLVTGQTIHGNQYTTRYTIDVNGRFWFITNTTAQLERFASATWITADE